MKLISKKLWQAIGACCYIAEHATRTKPLSTAKIAAHYNLKPRALEATMQTLARARLLTAIKGKEGGYFIENINKITLAHIAKAILETHDNTPAESFSSYQSKVEMIAQIAYDKWLHSLKNTTLADIIKQGPDLYDFTI